MNFQIYFQEHVLRKQFEVSVSSVFFVISDHFYLLCEVEFERVMNIVKWNVSGLIPQISAIFQIEVNPIYYFSFHQRSLIYCARKVFRKTNISYPLIKNDSFSGSFVYTLNELSIMVQPVVARKLRISILNILIYSEKK